jgi:uncharacterized membrane protein (DUF485 family)
LLTKLAIVLAAFAAGVGVAELFGAKNLGTALGVGQLTFVVALLYVLLRRDGSGPGSARQDQAEQ